MQRYRACAKLLTVGLPPNGSLDQTSSASSCEPSSDLGSFFLDARFLRGLAPLASGLEGATTSSSDEDISEHIGEVCSSPDEVEPSQSLIALISIALHVAKKKPFTLNEATHKKARSAKNTDPLASIRIANVGLDERRVWPHRSLPVSLRVRCMPAEHLPLRGRRHPKKPPAAFFESRG